MLLTHSSLNSLVSDMMQLGEVYKAMRHTIRANPIIDNLKLFPECETFLIAVNKAADSAWFTISSEAALTQLLGSETM